MNCHDARQQFSALVAGKVGLTEWVLVDAHVSECAECGDLLEELYRLRPRQDPGRRQAPALSADPQLGASDDAEAMVQPRRRPRSRAPILRILITAVLLLSVGAALAFSISPRKPTRLISLLTSMPRGVLPGTSPPAEFDNARTPAAIAPPPALAPELSPQPPQPPPDVKSGKTSRDGKAGAAASKLAPPSRVAPTTRMDRKGLPPRMSAVGAGAERPKQPAPETSAPAEIPESDVIVRLSVQDRGEAERDIGLLLTRLGGTRLARDRGSLLSVAIPRSSYGEFTRGLAQIGSWQTDASRTSLPDPVRVVVKLAR